MRVMITILAPAEDGEAILQLLAGDERFIFTSAEVPESDAALDVASGPLRRERGRMDGVDRANYVRLHSERLLGQALLQAAEARPSSGLTRDEAEQIAEEMGYARQSARKYLSGLTSKEGLLERTKNNAGEVVWKFRPAP